jgi:ribonucleoside-triphosphate reductase
MYILMSGTGVGFSVERQYVNQLPIVNEHMEDTNTTIVVEDSRSGWARGLRELISLLYSGQVPSWDMSKLRPAGARLKVSGGRSSGPEPLNELFYFLTGLFRKAIGRRLTSLECHDVMCKIGQVVVVGGVRRSALISLSNLSDDRMRDAKAGSWWNENPQRALSNNSVCYTEKPDTAVFMKEWLALYQSKSGERGIFNREAATKQASKNGRRKTEGIEFGCNPCSEILLRPYQFCNLTEVIVRSTDRLHDLVEKIRLATILGTFQSTLTDFKYLRAIWKKNTEEERLLGVSLTGIMDNPELVKTPEWLEILKNTAVEVNKKLSSDLGINQSVAITCVKPSGTVSQLVDSSSGIHPRWSPYYIRTVRGDNKDPITQLLKDQGVPNEPDGTSPNHVTVFSFPQKAPEGAYTRGDISALQHLSIWKNFQDNYCEHKPSITVNIKEKEWLQVQSWVWDNFDQVSGIAFLPYDEHSYKQAPYQEITKEQYDKLMETFPTKIDWDRLSEFEKEDQTSGLQDLACSGGTCEVVDLT